MSSLSTRSLSFILALAVCHSPVLAKMQETGSEGGVPEGLSTGDWSSIRQAYDAGRHAAQSVAGGYRAHNPGLQWQIDFDERGFVARSTARGGEHWSWGLDLLSYGFLGQECEVSEPAEIRAEGGRVAYDWDELVEEWYVNGASGLEHGYTIHRRPVQLSEEGQQGPLAFTLSVRGELAPALMGDGLGVRFLDDDGTTVLTYSGLKVFDAGQRVLPAWIEPGAEGFYLLVDERNARYPLTIDPTAQQAYLKPSNTDPGDHFGASVAVWGDTVVVGAPREDSDATGVNGDQNNFGASNSGAAYVFTRDGTTWVQVAYLKASTTFTNNEFGTSVAISGNTIVVGSPSENSNSTGVNGGQNNINALDSGAAYVFIFGGVKWAQQAYLKASNTDTQDAFGSLVAISGDIVVVGAPHESSNATGIDGDQSDNSAGDAGAAYIFERSGSSWSQQAYLKASNAQAGDDFGSSVAVSGNTVVVGAPREGSSATGVNGDQSDNSQVGAGAVYAFSKDGQGWSQQAYLKASNTAGTDAFGTAVGVSADTVVVGAPWERSSASGVNGDQSNNDAPRAGAVYAFERSGSTWSQQAYLKASNTLGFYYFGDVVAIEGDTLAVGSFNESGGSTGVNGDQTHAGNIQTGAAYVFVRSGTNWNQTAYLKASTADEQDHFGESIAVWGDTVIVGTTDEDSYAKGVNGNQNNNNATEAGAAYVFKLCPAELTASELVLLGTPPNPDAFRPGLTTGPVIGEVWDPYVDHTSFMPAALIDVYALQRTQVAALGSNLQLPLSGSSSAVLTMPNSIAPAAGETPTRVLGLVGTLICDRGRFHLRNRVPAGTPFAIAMPEDCSLVGTTWMAQAASIGADGFAHLTNALQITIGSF